MERLPQMPRLPSVQGAGRAAQPARIDPPSAEGIGQSVGEGGSAPGSGARAGQAVDLRSVQSAPPGAGGPSFHGPPDEAPVAWWLTAARVPYSYRDPAPQGRQYGGPGQQGRPAFVVADRARPLVIEVAEPHSAGRAALERQAGVLRRAALQRAGYRVVAVRPMDLATQLGETMTAALAGVQRFPEAH